MALKEIMISLEIPNLADLKEMGKNEVHVWRAIKPLESLSLESLKNI